MPLPRAQPEFHEGDWGTIVIFEVRNGRNKRVDLSFCVNHCVLFMRPDGSCFSSPACLLPAEDSLNPDGFDGFLFYIIQPGELIPAGPWFAQAFVDFSGGAWYSSVVPFTVFPNLIDLSEALLP